MVYEMIQEMSRKVQENFPLACADARRRNTRDPPPPLASLSSHSLYDI